MDVTIRELQTYEEMLAVHQLQHEIWGLTDPAFGIYPPLMTTAARNGGVVLGAFAEETNQLVGFLFGFLGRQPGQPLKLCSQAMGVLPAWRRQGVAESLKWAQRERALAQDLTLITWTFDPLEGPNANLNLHKLGALSRTYWRNIYGTNFGALNAGLPTDRLLVEWWLAADWIEADQVAREELAWYEASPIFEIGGQGLNRWISRADLVLADEMLLLEIPADFQRLKAANMELALDWRLKLRKAFEKYFDQGYLAIEFISVGEGAGRRNRYLLQKSSPALLAQLGLPT